MKVHEIAKAINLGTNEVMDKLKKMGVEVTSHMSAVDEDVAKKIINSVNKNIKPQNPEKTSASPKDANPHIIRRKVKVISTDEKGNEVENITTKSGNTIERKSIVHESKIRQNDYSKEGLGVVRSKHSKSNFNNRNRNNISNIVVTRNGKPIEPRKEEPKEIIKEELPANDKVVVTKEETVVKPVEKKQENRNNSFEKRNNNYDRRQNNGQNDSRDRKPFNRDNNGQRKPFNRDQNANGENRERRPFNRDNNGGRRPFNNQGNSTNYKVNQYIKEASQAPAIEKETRDYSNNVLMDKKKNTERNPEAKRERLNKNQMREADTRMEFSKFRGMQVDSSSDNIMEFYDRGDSGRKYGSKKKKQKTEMNHTKIIPLTEVTLPETMTVKEFAEAVKTQAADIIKRLFSLGIMATVNQEIDFDTAFLIASEMGINATQEVVVTEEDILFDDSEDKIEDTEVRPPIVTVMGHVDHGKTSLLDRIRKANVVSGEAGGITQHIGAYKVTINGKEITFLDTPGHEAFTEMRARGAQITDIVVIVVAADDGIKPQTREAISHAKAAGVSIIVAINKIDKPTANVERVKQELLEAELIPEEWGGDTIVVPVSAHTGEGIDNLLEMILLIAEVKEFRANPNKQSKGTVIEARLDKARGSIASVMVQRGTLNVGDTIVVGEIVGKIRSMTNDKGEKVKVAGPSTPVEILGLPAVPQTGDIFYEVKDEKTAHKLVEKRKAKARTELIKHGGAVTLDDLFSQIKEGEIKDLNIIIKADVQGSVEAIKDSLVKLSNDEVRVRPIHCGAGGINESDVTLAKVSGAIIIGFNVRPDALARAAAEKEKVDLRLYSVIYDAINDVEAAMKGMLAPTYKEVALGTAEVRKVFKASNIGTIAGSYITSGHLVRNALVRVVRDSVVVYEGKIESIKREKDDVREIAEGYECGIKIEKYNDIKELDILECYEMQEEQR